jgi:hypothetical protein
MAPGGALRGGAHGQLAWNDPSRASIIYGYGLMLGAARSGRGKCKQNEFAARSLRFAAVVGREGREGGRQGKLKNVHKSDKEESSRNNLPSITLICSSLALFYGFKRLTIIFYIYIPHFALLLLAVSFFLSFLLPVP